MIRRMLPVLATLTMLSAATSVEAAKSLHQRKSLPTLGPATSFARPNAKELLGEAKDLWHIKEDYTAALAKFNAAVDADPSDIDIRLQRGHFFEVLAAIVVEKDQAKFEARARIDYEYIAAADPESLTAGMARDGLTRLAGGSFIEAKRAVCPEAAAEAHSRGNMLYAARRFAEAAAEYEKAAAGCPEDAVFWVDLADSFYVREDYEKAKALFLKALSIDPWNREAHRFLSDAELQLSNGEAAVHHLVLAVVSDPIYEAGWSALKMYATAMDRKWNRVYGDRNAGAPWAAYGAAKAHARDASPPASALAIEREAVKAALRSSTGSEPFWSMMARAERAGFLDEAIFIHLLDASLVAEYPGFRERNAERLAAYLHTVILR